MKVIIILGHHKQDITLYRVFIYETLILFSFINKYISLGLNILLNYSILFKYLLYFLYVKRYPNYYEVIENPIDLRSIARKIQDGKYANLAEMERELLIMTKNACLFNEPGSQIYKDAKTLKKVITSKKIEVDHGKYAPSKSSERIR